MEKKDGGIIIRKKLMRLFDSFIDERVIYVSAPAGFGKTVGVRQWLKKEKGSITSIVISLDEYDNSVPHLSERFVSALTVLEPRNKLLSEILSHPTFSNAPDEFTLKAISSLKGKKQCILVLDDLHNISDEKIHRLLLVFLKRLPENFKFIFISRSELPMGFSDLWVSGQLAKVGADKLRFTGDEIIQLYKNRGNILTKEKAGDIVHFTDGWAIGINALLLSGGEPVGESFEALNDFLLGNVWNRWEDGVKEFMIATSLFPVLTPEFCSAITEIKDSKKILNNLSKENAFLLYDKDTYRYHNLFREFLNRLAEKKGRDFLVTLWNKAGDWFLAKKDFYNALDSFVKSENIDGIIKSFSLLIVSSEEYFFIEKLISSMDVSLIDKAAEKNPYIYSTLAWAAYNDGRVEDMARHTDLYYKNQEKIIAATPELASNLILIRLIDFRVSLKDLLNIPRGLLGTNVIKNITKGDVKTGIINQNLPFLHRGTRDFSEIAIGDINQNILVLRNSLGGFFGEKSLLMAECLAAGIYYERGDLDKAYSHIISANSLIKNTTSSEAKFFIMAPLIDILDGLDKKEETEEAINRIDTIIEEDKSYHLIKNFKALIAKRKLRDGDILTANEWIEKHYSFNENFVKFHNLFVSFTTCRSLIAVGNYSDAVILLKNVLELSIAYNRPLDVIEAQILLAIAYWKMKRTFQKAALKYLEEAVSLAYKFQYKQMFINDGAELSGMLRRLVNSVEQRQDEVLAPISFIKSLHINSLGQKSEGLTSRQPSKPIKFTEKQKAVMRLITEGKTYAEMAEIIGIKRSTLRSHISLIYKKLDVTSEIDAVLKIKEAGYLNDQYEKQ